MMIDKEHDTYYKIIKSDAIDFANNVATYSTVQDLESKVRKRLICIDKVLRRERWVKKR